MPSLIVPGPSDGKSNLEPMSIEGVANKVSSGAKIGQVQQTAGAAANASAAQIGEVQANLGKWVMAQGDEMLGRGLKSMQDAIYNIVQSNAAQDYNKQSSDAIKNDTAPSDDPRVNYSRANKFQNPQALVSDLDNISDNVKNKYGDAIQDPASKAEFQQSLDNLNTNRKMTASASQRASQLDLSQKALMQGLQSDIQSGIMDVPENLGFYAQQGLSRIGKALESGYIAPEQAAKMGDVLRKGLYLGTLSANNKKDPNSVAELLATRSANELNLTEIEYNQLVKQNQLALADANALSKNQYQAQNEVSNAQRRLFLGSLRDEIRNNAMNGSQLQEAYDKGKIDFEEYSSLIEEFGKTRQKVDRTWAQRQDISSAIKSGDVLGAYDNRQIDDHYTHALRSLSKDGSPNVDFNTKVDVAKHYKGPISVLENDIEYAVKTGNPDKIKEAVFAYDRLQNENPLVLSGIKDKKMIAYISALSNAYKYTTDPLTSDNIQKIHDSIYDIDGKTFKQRSADYSKSSAFTDANIQNTIAEMYAGGDPWFGKHDVVNNDVISMLRPMLREAYLQTGSVSAAKSAVANQTKALFGHSSVNNISQWGSDAGSIMALPPESVYRAKPAEIRAAINKEIANELPEGITPDQVLIGSDDLTIKEARSHGVPSYYLYYKDSNGQEKILPNRWKMDNTSLKNIQELRYQLGQKKVAPESQVQAIQTKPNEQKQNIALVQNRNEQIFKAVIGDTKEFGKSPILNQEFIEKAAREAYLPQIAKHYPGDKNAQPVVVQALQSMVGADNDSWRVGQAIKLVNSVLVNNASPETYLRYGTVSNDPNPGDVVVGKNGAGLFAGNRNINGQVMVQIATMKGGKLHYELIEPKDVKGYRQLPTPENFYRSSGALSISNTAPRFNPYTGEPARQGTGKERFNVYNMTTSLDDGSKKGATIINPSTGQMSSVNTSFNEQAQSIIGQENESIQKARREDPTAEFSLSNAPGQEKANSKNDPTAQYSVSGGVGGGPSADGIATEAKAKSKGQEQPKSRPKSNNAKALTKQEQVEYVATKSPDEAEFVRLKSGEISRFIQFENGQVRLGNGKVVKQNEVVGFLKKKSKEPTQANKSWKVGQKVKIKESPHEKTTIVSISEDGREIIDTLGRVWSPDDLIEV